MSLKLFASGLVACISLCSCALAQESTSSDKHSSKDTDDSVLIVEIDEETGEYKVRPIDKNGGRVIHWIGDLAFQEKSDEKTTIATNLKQDDEVVVLNTSNLSKKDNVFVLEKGSQEKSKEKKSQKQVVWVTDSDEEIVLDGKNVEQKIVLSPRTGERLIWNQDNATVTGDIRILKRDQDESSKEKIPADVKKILKEHGIVIAELDNLDIDIKQLDDHAKRIVVKAEKNNKGNVERKVINVQVRKSDHPSKSGKYRLQEQVSPSDKKDLSKKSKSDCH